MPVPQNSFSGAFYQEAKQLPGDMGDGAGGCPASAAPGGYNEGLLCFSVPAQRPL